MSLPFVERRKRMDRKMWKGTSMTSRATLVAAAVLMSVTSGCGFNDIDVVLTYKRAVACVHSDRGGDVYVEKVACPQVIETEQRLHDVVVGSLDIQGISDMGSIRTVNSPSAWIGDALCKELDAAGYTPRLVDALPPTADLAVRTRLVKVWVEGHEIGRWIPIAASANVKLQMALYRGGSIVKEFDVTGSGTAEPDESLTIALEDCMKKAVPLIMAGFGE